MGVPLNQIREAKKRRKRNDDTDPAKATPPEPATTTTPSTLDATTKKLKEKVDGLFSLVRFRKRDLEKEMKALSKKMEKLEPDVRDKLLPELTKAVEL